MYDVYTIQTVGFLLFFYYLRDYAKDIQKKWYYVALILAINIIVGLIFNFIIYGKFLIKINIITDDLFLCGLPKINILIPISILNILNGVVFLFAYDKMNKIAAIDPEKNDNIEKNDHDFLNLKNTLLISAITVFSRVFNLGSLWFLSTVFMLFDKQSFKESIKHSLIFFYLLSFVDTLFLFFNKPGICCMNKYFPLYMQAICLLPPIFIIKYFKDKQNAWFGVLLTIIVLEMIGCAFFLFSQCFPLIVG